MKGKYDKVHLVPFGEYVPFKKWLPFIGKMVEQVGDFSPGPEGCDHIPWKNHHLGVLICYEVYFPGFVQTGYTKRRIGARSTSPTTPGMARTSAPYQHFSMAVFRAVENRGPLIRSANTGFHGFIDPAGRILN